MNPKSAPRSLPRPAQALLPSRERMDLWSPLPRLVAHNYLLQLPSGELVEIDFIWKSARRWAEDERSKSPDWHEMRIGMFSLAVRFTGPSARPPPADPGRPGSLKLRNPDGSLTPLALDRWAVHIDPGNGRLLTLDSLWMTARRWRRRPESRSPEWRTRRLGPFVLAMRILG